MSFNFLINKLIIIITKPVRRLAFPTLLINLIAFAQLASGQLSFPKYISSNFQKEYAIILSPRPRRGVPWGGYHITITGYTNNHNCLNNEQDCNKLIKEAWQKVHRGKSWHLHTFPDSKNLRCDKTCILYISSQTLNKLAQELERKGFKRLKGPEYEKKTQWHISTHKRDRKEAEKLINQLSDKNVLWHLWWLPKPSKNCQIEGNDCPNWEGRRIQ